jgi:hypothetical protein
MWFGVDDSTYSVHTPIYCSLSRVPSKWANGFGDALTFEWSAFWTFNVVANMVYGNNRVGPEVREEVLAKEKEFQDATDEMDRVALSLWQSGQPQKAVESLSKFSINTANNLVDYWIKLWMRLFVKYRDGFVVTRPSPPVPDHNGDMGGVVPDVDEVGYSLTWYDTIVNNTGDKFLVPEPNEATTKRKRRGL